MKKSALIILLCAILSVSLFAAVAPSGVDDSLGTILNLTTVENQAVSAPVFGVVDFYVYPSQWESVLSVNILPVNINLEMENIENVTTLKAFNLRPENYRGDVLHSAGFG